MTMTTTPITFKLMCLDPVHVGVGQDIMGEVDLPIDRETETRVPRIPGPTVKGGFRSNARWKLRMDGKRPSKQLCSGDKPSDENKKTTRIFCGTTNCPICQTFGWPGNKETSGNEGRVFFSDARLAFFPAVTNNGTLWFSTPGRAAAYLNIGAQLAAIETTDPLIQIRPELAFGIGECFAVSKAYSNLTTGWIKIQGIPHEVPASNPLLNAVVAQLKQSVQAAAFPTKAFWETVVQRTILLDETTFYRVVETCLERRTCNKINEETGTVQDEALFSYEALPRLSLLYSRIDVDDCGFPDRSNEFPYDSPLDICNLAREGLARMGIGGLQTRGLGNILVEPLPAKGITKNGH